MNDKLVELLDSLSKKLNTTAEHLYTVLVKQVRVDSIMAISRTLFLLLLLIPCYFGWVFLVPKCIPVNPPSDMDWPTSIQISVVFYAILTLILVIAIIVEFLDAIETSIAAIMNPEGAAIEKILDSINK